MHLRLFDVVSSGIAAHPQCFVVVHHDVQLSCGATLGGGKAMSGSLGHVRGTAWQHYV